MDYDLVVKLKNCLKVPGLKISGNKNELVARVFSAIENNVMPVKTAVEIEEDLKKEYEKKLKADDRLIPDPFQIPHGWLEEDEGITFWPMLSHPDIFNYLMFGSTDLSDNKNSKAYSYYKFGWLQPLYFHKLSGSKCCIFKGEYRQSERINERNHKLWIIMEKSGKIGSCTRMVGMGQSYNHVAAAMYRIEATVRNELTSPSCTSTANQWLPNHKNVQPIKVKDMNFGREDFCQRGKKKRPLSNRLIKFLKILAAFTNGLVNQLMLTIFLQIYLSTCQKKKYQKLNYWQEDKAITNFGITTGQELLKYQNLILF